VGSSLHAHESSNTRGGASAGLVSHNGAKISNTPVGTGCDSSSQAELTGLGSVGASAGVGSAGVGSSGAGVVSRSATVHAAASGGAHTGGVFRLAAVDAAATSRGGHAGLPRPSPSPSPALAQPFVPPLVQPLRHQAQPVTTGVLPSPSPAPPALAPVVKRETGVCVCVFVCVCAKLSQMCSMYCRSNKKLFCLSTCPKR